MIHLQSLFNLPSLTTETSNDLRTLCDQTNKAIQVLSNLGCATEHWDDWLFLVTPKLDKSSQKTWELKLGDTIDYPCYRELDQFLAFVRSHRAEKATSKRKTLVLHTAPMFCFCAHYAKRTYCINVLCSLSKLHLNVLNALKLRNAVWTISVRSMLWKFVQILARVEYSVVNGIVTFW